MPPNLRPLPKALVEKIRTGVTLNTVPQAVVELLCNALDAEARTVLIKLNAGSLSFTVEDDGCGMCSEDLELVGTRYHTSKLRSLTDFAAGILTLGFRGEATSGLVRIAAELAVTTRARGRFETLSKVLRNGGAEARSGPSAVALTHCGTVVVAKRLLFNQPVRHRQLAAQPRETEAETIQAVLRTALPFTATAVTLLREPSGQVLLHLPKGRDMRALFLQLCPEQPAAALPWLTASAPAPPSGVSVASAAAAANAPVRTSAATATATASAGSGSSASSGSSYTVRALLGSPAAAYPHPHHQYVYVNRRHVRHPQLAALLNAHFLRAHLKAGHHLLRNGGAAGDNGSGAGAGAGAGAAAGAGGPVRTSSVRALPAFVVCIECSASHYDVTSEPDKSDLVFRHLHLVSGLLRHLAGQAWGGSDGGGGADGARGGAAEREAERGGDAAACCNGVKQGPAAAGSGSAAPVRTTGDGKGTCSARDQRQAKLGGAAFGGLAGDDADAADLLAEGTSPTLSAELAALRASTGAARSDAAAASVTANGGVKQPGASGAADGPLRGLLHLQSLGRAAVVGMQSKSLSVAAVGALAAEAREPRPTHEIPTTGPGITAAPPHHSLAPGGSRICGSGEGVHGGSAVAARGDPADRTPPLRVGLAAAAGVRVGPYDTNGGLGGSSLDASPSDIDHEQQVVACQQHPTAHLANPDSSPLPDFSPGLPSELADARCDDGMASVRLHAGLTSPNGGAGGSQAADSDSDFDTYLDVDNLIRIVASARPRSLYTSGSEYDAFGSPVADDCGSGSTGSEGPWQAEECMEHDAGRWAGAGGPGASGSSPPRRAYVSPLAWRYGALESPTSSQPPASSRADAVARHAPCQAAAERLTGRGGEDGRQWAGPAQHDPDWDEGRAPQADMEAAEASCFRSTAVGTPTGEGMQDAMGWARGTDSRSTASLDSGGPSLDVGGLPRSNGAAPYSLTPSDVRHTLDAAFPVDDDDLGGSGSWEERQAVGADTAADADASALRPQARPVLGAGGDMGGFLRSLCEQPELASAAGSSKGHAAAAIRRVGRCGHGPAANAAPGPSLCKPATDGAAHSAKPPEERRDQQQRQQMPVLVGVPIAPSPQDQPPAAKPAGGHATAATGGAQAGNPAKPQRALGSIPQDADTGLPPAEAAHDQQSEVADSLSPLARFLSFGNVTGMATTPPPSPAEQPPAPVPCLGPLPSEASHEHTAPPSPIATRTAAGCSAAATAGGGPVAAAVHADAASGLKLLAPRGCVTPSSRPQRSPSRRLVQSAPPHAKKRARSVHGNPGASLASACPTTGTHGTTAAAGTGGLQALAAAVTGRAAGADASAPTCTSPASRTVSAVGGSTAAAVPTTATQPAAALPAAPAAAAPHMIAAALKPGAPQPVCTFFRGPAAAGRRQAAGAQPAVCRPDAEEVAVHTQAADHRLQAREQPVQLGQKRSHGIAGVMVAPCVDVSHAESTASAPRPGPSACGGDNGHVPPQAPPSASPAPLKVKRLAVQQQDLANGGDGRGTPGTAALAVAALAANGTGVMLSRQVSRGSRPDGSSAAGTLSPTAGSSAAQQGPATTQRAARLPPANAPRSILKKLRPTPPSVKSPISPGGPCEEAAQVQPQEAARPAKRVRWSLPPSPPAAADSGAGTGDSHDNGAALPVVLHMKHRRVPTAAGSLASTAGGGPLVSAASLHHGLRPAGRGLVGGAGAGYTLLPEHDAAVAASAAAASSVAPGAAPDVSVPPASSVAALLPSALGLSGLVSSLPTTASVAPTSSAPQLQLQQALRSASPFARAAAAAAAMLAPQAATPPVPSLASAHASSPFAAAATIAAAAMSSSTSQQPLAAAAATADDAGRSVHASAGLALPAYHAPASAQVPQSQPLVPAPAPGARPEEPILDLERDLLRLQAPREQLVPPEVTRSGLAAGATGGALRQVEGKFIPAVGKDGCLLVVDQHAAHERVRLEQLTQALALARESGAGSAGRLRTGSSGPAQQGPAASAAERIARVDALWPGAAPASLPGSAPAGQAHAVLPAADDAALLFSQQLSPAVPVRLSVQEAATADQHLQVLAEWGWQLAPAALAPSAPAGGGAFVPPTAAVLAPQEETHQLMLAVPVVCGAALTPTDLRVYLGQLRETGGSRLPPPAVLRLLRSRSCRTAVMFGDPLSSSQCGRLLAALRATALWTQCAHGRPTAAPLVHLPSLRAVLGRRRAAREAVVAAAAGGGGASGGSAGGAGAGVGGGRVAGEGDERVAKRRRFGVEALRAVVTAGRKERGRGNLSTG